MPNFSYTARLQNGEKVEGTLEANDQNQALILIERKGLYPISVKESGMTLSSNNHGPKKKLQIEWRRKPKMKMGMREALVFTQELSDLLASGMKLGQALHAIAQRKTGKSHDDIISNLRDEVVQGTSLSDALAKHPKTFAPLYISMVRAGEASGRLADSLEQLCYHYERVHEAREKVVMALTYPAIVMIMGIVTVIVCMVFVVPQFTEIFESIGGTLPLPTRILIGISDGLLHYGVFIAAALIAAVVSFKKYIKTDKGKELWHRFLMRAPVCKNIILPSAYTHFAQTLGALLENGVPILQAMTIVEDTVGNVIIAREIREARNQVTDGSTISTPLANSKVFPRLFTDMLAVGEQTGDISGALKHIAKRYDDELNRGVKLFTTILEPVLLLFIALMVGFIAVSMLMAVFEMTGGLNV